jgi:hypothetical protein
MLKLKGVVITITGQIVEKGGDCILSVKGICAPPLIPPASNNFLSRV